MKTIPVPLALLRTLIDAADAGGQWQYIQAEEQRKDWDDKAVAKLYEKDGAKYYAAVRSAMLLLPESKKAEACPPTV